MYTQLNGIHGAGWLITNAAGPQQFAVLDGECWSVLYGMEMGWRWRWGMEIGDGGCGWF